MPPDKSGENFDFSIVLIVLLGRLWEFGLIGYARINRSLLFFGLVCEVLETLCHTLILFKLLIHVDDTVNGSKEQYNPTSKMKRLDLLLPGCSHHIENDHSPEV